MTPRMYKKKRQRKKCIKCLLLRRLLLLCFFEKIFYSWAIMARRRLVGPMAGENTVAWSKIGGKKYIGCELVKKSTTNKGVVGQKRCKIQKGVRVGPIE